MEADIEVAGAGAAAYSTAELMAVVMSRALEHNDGQVGGVGAGATIPMAALRLATLTVAPGLNWFCGSSGGFNPTFDHLPLTAADPRALHGAEATQTMQDIVDLGGSGRWGFGFHGGMQIDRYGNANLIGIGPYDNLRVRGPGSVGLPWAARMSGAYLFTWHHNPRVFVERVDHLSGPGWLDGDSSRAELLDGVPGPRLVFTPLCVMDFHETSHAMRLLSVHPGHSVGDVAAQTGFDVIVPDDVPETPRPTDQELFLLRTRVDRGRQLRDLRLTVG
ncbi:CoA-transferase [Streptomyces sp. NPDC090493]|uniref:CoA-transferase n=1 Tax=Streptomyces sp. NPDC090493 TaxID=3365964 RepID=UPI003802A50C